MDGGGRRNAVRVWGREWTKDERELLIICEKELLASTWGLVAFAPWLQKGVVSWTGNTVAMAAMRSMAPRTEVIQEITARRTEYLFHGEILEESRLITSKANLWADLGSRGQMAAAVQQATACGRAEGDEVGGDVPGVARHVSAARC